jgi:hypothetical protein
MQQLILSFAAVRLFSMLFATKEKTKKSLSLNLEIEGCDNLAHTEIGRYRL